MSDLARLISEIRETAKIVLALLLLAAVTLVGCAKPVSTTIAAAPRVRTSQLPTATEVFQLRGLCQQLGEKLDESLPYGAHWTRQTVTNYSPEVNRCYVEMADSNDIEKEYSRNLYDGQTKDLLAFTKTHGPASRQTQQVGQIFMDNNIDTVIECKDGGDCGYRKVNDFIDEKMKRDDAVTQ